jgi:hypothetical protein
MDAPPTWRSGWHVDTPAQTPPVPVVHVAEREEPDVVGTIHGPDGKPLHTVTRPARAPFGFSR